MSSKDIYYDLDLQKVNQLLQARLQNITTADRTTLGGTLGVSNKGLVVYDTDTGFSYIWDGAAWDEQASSLTSPVQFKGVITDLSDPVNVVSPAAGHMYIIGTAGTLTITGVTFSPSAVVEVGDSVLFTSATEANIFQKNDIAASETVAGNIEIATQAETDAGTDDARAVTPLKLKTYLNTKDAARAYYEGGITLVNNTPYTVTHNLGLNDANAFSVRVANSSGSEIEVDIDAVDANSFTITAQPGVTGAKVFVVGLGDF